MPADGEVVTFGDTKEGARAVGSNVQMFALPNSLEFLSQPVISPVSFIVRRQRFLRDPAGRPAARIGRIDRRQLGRHELTDGNVVDSRQPFHCLLFGTMIEAEPMSWLRVAHV